MRDGLGAVLLSALVACGGGATRRPPPEAPSSRAPELASVAPDCDDATLRAFDPGLPGLARGEIERRDAPDAALMREHVRACEPAEDDELCQLRARRDVLAADPTATISEARMDGEPDGWSAQLDVDGQRQEVILPEGADVVAEARRLRALGHRVVPIEGRRLFREGSRRAVVPYVVRTPRAPVRVRWQATYQGPRPADVPGALDQLQRAVADASLTILRYELADDGLTAVVACP